MPGVGKTGFFLWMVKMNGGKIIHLPSKWMVL
ncbi:Uncharacterised protein [Bordetella ansorpii]|uniref:Uncharacterized protein n=1 Tax=Bordetella ansorpii TaxID=288768 RepID=A0A157SG20_9BORD|nr:Uncharacterised protein [Bordetella ansorpii]